MTTQFISEKFLEQYRGKKPPMTDLGEFVYYRTYSRWLEEQKRREVWLETITRASSYNVDLEYKHRVANGLDIDMTSLTRKAEKLVEWMFDLAGFVSGRTLWVGGTPVAEKFPLSNFNCAFTTVERFKDFGELFYLLMVGSGAGFRNLNIDASNIENYRHVEMTIKPYTPVPKESRKDLTEFTIEGDKATIVVGDSKEGWVSSLDTFFGFLVSHLYRGIKQVEINFDNVRPKGERLKTFGGTASGHESLKTMFVKIKKVLDSHNGNLGTLGVLDVCNIIGENVVVGGVRRTSEICLCGEEDTNLINAKNNLFMFDKDGKYLGKNKEIEHREMSNNSILFNQRPSRDRLKSIFKSIRISAEPGFYNMEEVNRRVRRICKLYDMEFRERKGTNPCGEILLDSKQTCNLTTNNLMAYVRPDGTLDMERLLEGFRIFTEAGVRMTLVELEIPEWSYKQKRDRLIGVSLTGWFDMVNAVGLSRAEQRMLLRTLRETVRDTANSLADELGIPRPLLTTTVKPEGSLSQLPTVSSGIHASHSPFYIRRVRINEDDALCKMAKELGWRMERVNNSTMAIEFPIKAPEGRTKHDVSAIEQLELYKMFMEEYVEHNASITVHVRDHEWEEAEQWVYDNWDSVIGITFINLNDGYYPLMPYEAIDEEEYNKRVAEMKPFNEDILNKYETGKDKEILDDDCGT